MTEVRNVYTFFNLKIKGKIAPRSLGLDEMIMQKLMLQNQAVSSE